MTRLAKFLSLAGLASIYLMQTPCAFTTGGISLLGSPFKSFSLATLLGTGT